ncbi:MAG: glycogen/starch synthase, ADP-glucose type [Planctomycetaceae bacterium]|nr:glycogen/starch synthase, ADP-glucose type [Planctomycetaceae bacterium]
MNIVMVSPEATPFATAGALGEQVTQLAEELVTFGHHVTLILPHHPASIIKSGFGRIVDSATRTGLQIRIGTRLVNGSVLRLKPLDSRLDIVLIDQPDYFCRPHLYQDSARDHRDNCERFIFFSRAAVEVLKLLELPPDVVHCHDWETGLIPALLKIEHRQTPGLIDLATVLSIHDIKFQGQFWHWDMELTGLDWKYFNWRQMEFFGQLNLLKTGIVFSDAITVANREYAKAIQTAEFGCGLHGVLRQRSEHLIGISQGSIQYVEVYRHAMRNDTESQLCVR